MKIAILDDYQDLVKSLQCFKLLAAHDVTVLNKSCNPKELIKMMTDIEAIVLIRERTEITRELLEHLPTLKVISQTGKVSNHINVDLCSEYGVQVLEGIGSPVAPAELCWSLIMSASRYIPQYAANLKENRWQNNGSLGAGRTLKGLQLGIWGYGKIGRRIAHYARAFEMNVVVWGSEKSREQAEKDGLSSAATKSEFFSESDIVSLHLRLNEVTRHCVTADDLMLMKSDSLFVNTSRSELIEPSALYIELKNNPTKRAAIDVFHNEPATLENEPLLSLSNVTATPHIGYVEKNSYELYFERAFENLIDWIQNDSKSKGHL